ncbi:cytidine deaminase [Rhodopirellula sp. MGV]|uniref:cytidine deaminase n=1 Tax=Rhodopirellula sp. MGV TaxID=2023130 RepID=UPI000B9793E1|nr:cytidine deaminase [Rhodopirellula sp. MGV]OYP28348.1 cytidine deaminase [Rhodopirellula sp. MGV]PNY38776.1 cytidine deaminase [Rhodopirellula baltica]
MFELKPKEIDRLVRAAIDARDQAYAPHSHFYVGAALWIPSGEIVHGCNVENASYSLSICAERVAASTAVMKGYREFHAIAVASVGGVSPCGACRQFLSEFGMDVQIIMADVLTGARQIRSLSQLLPDAFDASNLPTN